MIYESKVTPLERLYYWEKQAPQKTYLRQPINGQWREFSWSEVVDQTRKIATSLNDMGVLPGDRVAILSKNCAEWFIADFAIMMLGAVSIPLYATQNPETLTYVLEHSESKALFIGKLDEVTPAAAIPDSIQTIAMPYELSFECDYEWNELLKKHQPLKGNPIWGLERLSTIVYTSGTTGLPKGVMHSVGSITFATDHFCKHFGFNQDDRFISYLPLSHIAERSLVELSSLYSGGVTSFVESMDTFAANLQSVSPTVFFSVPRLWQKFQDAISEKLPPKKLALLLKIPLISGLVKKKIRQNLGLNGARAVGSGAAPISANLIEWFASLGVVIREGYGQTENMAYSTVNNDGNIKPGSVGVALPDCEIKIGEGGEILVKSDATMMGYYKADQATEEVMLDGYLKTGDVGSIDSNGFLKITGRVKEIFKTDKGKYVAPAPIESRFLDFAAIDQLCLVGHGFPQPVALVVPSVTGMNTDPTQFESELQTIRLEINSRLESHERVGKILVCKEQWTQEKGFLTPTLKLKRHVVEKHYEAFIDNARSDQQPILWEN